MINPKSYRSTKKRGTNDQWTVGKTIHCPPNSSQTVCQGSSLVLYTRISYMDQERAAETTVAIWLRLQRSWLPTVFHVKITNIGTFLVVQGLKLHTSTTGGCGFQPLVWELGFSCRMGQAKKSASPQKTNMYPCQMAPNLRPNILRSKRHTQNYPSYTLNSVSLIIPKSL